MKLITVREASELYKIKKSTLYLWCSNGMIPHYKIGALVRFKPEEIEGWLEKFKKEACKSAKKACKSSRVLGGCNIDEIVRKAIEDASESKI